MNNINKKRIYNIIIALFLIFSFIFSSFANNVIISQSPNGNNYSGKQSNRIYTIEANEDKTGTGPGSSISDGSINISKGPVSSKIFSNNTTFTEDNSNTNNQNINNNSNNNTTNEETLEKKVSVTFDKISETYDFEPKIKAGASFCVNLNNNKIYYASSEHEKLAPASLTMLVSAYLLTMQYKLDDIAIVSKNAVKNLEEGASNIGLKENDAITVNDILHSMLLKSACDSANVCAEKVSGSINKFVEVMNYTVKLWGCNDTNFTNPSGLNDVNQFTSAYDMGIILSKINQNEVITKVLEDKSWTLNKTNHRQKLFIESNYKTKNVNSGYYNKDFIFGKQGYTSKALYTLGSVFKYKGQNIAIVILKSNNEIYNSEKSLYTFAKKVVDSLNLSDEDKGKWVKDDKGWYYIKENGQKAVNEWIILKNVKYCVDSDGYMITGWREFTNGNLYYFDPTSGALKNNTWVNTSNGAYFLQEDGSLARAEKGKTKIIDTSAGKYIIDENGKALSKAE